MYNAQVWTPLHYVVPIFTFDSVEPKNRKSTQCLQIYDAGCKAVTRPLAL